jgi:hypothetical protein
MSTIAVRRGFALLLATLLAVVACYTVLARSARASVRPAAPTHVTKTDPGKSHRPVIGSGVKYVRNADGSVTQTR